jgi:cytidylate kinase
LKPPIIAIDGPAGAGKTTISRRLAEKLGYRYVDTGALYRGIAWKAAQENIDIADDRAVARLVNALRLEAVWTGDGAMHILIDGRDVTDDLRTPRISMLASRLSALPAVRRCLLDLQRRLGREGGCVFEGRDMGTVVFPDAAVKIFLDASLEKRSQRRYREIRDAGGQSLEEVQQDIRRRDENDSTRRLAPLKRADDAVYIDTTDLNIDQVLEKIGRVVEQRG